MAKLSKILKDISKLPEEEQLEVKSWFEEELEEPKKEEPKETPKEEPKEEPKQEKPKETKEDNTVQFDVDKFKEEIIGLFEEKFKPYVTKDELEEIKKEIPKAKDFGVQPKNTSVDETDFEKSREKVLSQLN